MTGNKPLTSRQDKVLTFIRDYTTARGYPPSMREIGNAVGLVSTSSVAYVLRCLVEAGHIQRSPGNPRAIVLTGSPAVSVARDDLLRLLGMALAVTREDDEFLDRVASLVREPEPAASVIGLPGAER